MKDVEVEVGSDFEKGSAKLLFYHFSETEYKLMQKKHEHSIWQCEVVTKGPIGVECDNTSELQTGDMLLIPPNVSHRFIYHNKMPVAWLTMRFTFSEDINLPEEKIIRSSSAANGFFDLLISLLEKDRAPLPDIQKTIELIVAAMVSYAYAGDKAAPGGNKFLNKVNACINSNLDQKITITDVADYVGYSVSHTSAEYRRLTGNNLKNAIDNARAKAAEKLLKYSDYTISQIARTMDFDNVYAFSRFFKRLTGKSPREFRQLFPKL